MEEEGKKDEVFNINGNELDTPSMQQISKNVDQKKVILISAAVAIALIILIVIIVIAVNSGSSGDSSEEAYNDESKKIHNNLQNKIFKKKNSAIKQVYDLMMSYLKDNNLIDELGIIRYAYENTKVFEDIDFKVYKDSNVTKLYLDKLSKTSFGKLLYLMVIFFTIKMICKIGVYFFY